MHDSCEIFHVHVDTHRSTRAVMHVLSMKKSGVYNNEGIEAQELLNKQAGYKIRSKKNSDF